MKLSPIAVVTSLPAANVEPPGFFRAEGGNVISIMGQATNAGPIYLLRKVIKEDGSFQYLPYKPDRPYRTNPAVLSGYFHAQFETPAKCADQFVLCDDGGVVGITGAGASAEQLR